MFYCDDCGKENSWPTTMGKNIGKCEICKKQTACNDLPSKYLPARVKLKHGRRLILS